MNARLVVIDVDGTLVHTSQQRLTGHAFAETVLHLGDDLTLYTYTRPYVADLLSGLRADYRNILMIYSAGGFDYVHRIVNQVIYPEVRKLCPNFFFDLIFTANELPSDGLKKLDNIKETLRVSNAIIIDDLLDNCLCNPDDCYCYVNSFDPHFAHNDQALLMILDHSFFKR